MFGWKYSKASNAECFDNLTPPRERLERGMPTKTEMKEYGNVKQYIKMTIQSYLSESIAEKLYLEIIEIIEPKYMGDGVVK